MRWKLKSSKIKSQWHEWFAWYPIKICRTIVWFEKVERKMTYDFDGTSHINVPSYRWI